VVTALYKSQGISVLIDFEVTRSALHDSLFHAAVIRGLFDNIAAVAPVRGVCLDSDHADHRDNQEEQERLSGDGHGEGGWQNRG
jgi:hypothetical protein